MTQEIINVGTGPDSYTGESLRSAFEKVNNNFSELYAAGLGSGIVNTGVFVLATLPPAASVGAGARAFVSDADSTVFGAEYVGGSVNRMPVWSDGIRWYIG